MADEEQRSRSAEFERQCEVAVIQLCQAIVGVELPNHIGFQVTAFIVSETGEVHGKSGGNAPIHVLVNVLEEQLKYLRGLVEAEKAEAQRKLD